MGWCHMYIHTAHTRGARAEEAAAEAMTRLPRRRHISGDMVRLWHNRVDGERLLLGGHGAAQIEEEKTANSADGTRRSRVVGDSVTMRKSGSGATALSDDDLRGRSGKTDERAK